MEPITVSYNAPDNMFETTCAVVRQMQPGQARLTMASQVALGIVTAMLIGLAAIIMTGLLGIYGDGQQLLVFGAICGALLVLIPLTRRMGRRMSARVNEVIRPGTAVHYTFDNDGVRMRTWCHDWRCAWAGVGNITSHPEGVSIASGLTVFVLPRAAMDKDLDALTKRLVAMRDAHQ